MEAFPMFIKTTGRRVVIVGGGEQAAQKTRLMLKTTAQIVLRADALDDELADLVATGRAAQIPGPITAQDFAGAAMVFIATGCPGTDAALHAVATSTGVPVNVVDQPALCQITTPSIVDRDPVVIAIGTEGTAPVLARRIKTDIEQQLDPSLGAFAALAGRLRSAVERRVPKPKRRAFWAWAFKSDPMQTHKRGGAREAANLLKQAIAAGGAPEDTGSGSIAIVGAGPGARDLLTLRAVERLQEADVIFYDDQVDEGVLELARRDAERVFTGQTHGAIDWPQGKTETLMIAAARQGQRVVCLRSGDPSEADTTAPAAILNADVPIEIVPGIGAKLASNDSRGSLIATA